ncbi:MAG: sensor domain-containing diguanylate cyclase [Proteobacteria bacterium]|nr:MAG: sensor domain-containing diguanylate cyclase [Pseudomonadota bacterium]
MENLRKILMNPPQFLDFPNIALSEKSALPIPIDWTRVESWDEDAQRFAWAFRYAASGMALVSRYGKVLSINAAYGAFIGYSESELHNLNFENITHPEDQAVDLFNKQQLLKGKTDSFQMEKRYKHREGYWVWGLLSMSLVRDGSGEILYFISQVQDITSKKLAEAKIQKMQEHLRLANQELSQANETLQKLAHDDGLTGLKNRRSFDQRLREEIARSRRTRVSFSLVLLDIDHFKMINDNWGHSIGDEVLRLLASLLNQTLRTVDIIARYGGEEFAFILPGTGTLGGFRAAERCRDAIANYSWPYQQVTASCGVTTWENEDEHTILVRADSALYMAKEKGRNCVCHSQLEG